MVWLIVSFCSLTFVNLLSLYISMYICYNINPIPLVTTPASAGLYTF